MKNLKVGKKLMVVFGIVLALFIGTASVSGYCLTKVAGSLSTFYNEQFQVVSAQYSMRVALQATVRYLLWACTTDSDAETEEYIAKAQEQLEIMKAGIPTLQEKFKGDSSLVSDFQNLITSAGPVREDLVQMVRKNEFDSSIAMFNSQYVPLVTQAQDKLVKIGEIASNDAAAGYEESQTMKRNATAILISSIIFSIVLIVFFCIYITRSIVGPIREIEEAARGIASGKLDSKIAYHSGDELGGLAESLRSTIHSMDVIINDIAFLTSELSKGNFKVISPNRAAYVGAFKPILLSIRAMKDHLSSAMRQISDAADQVTIGSDQISSTAQSLSQGSSEQASSVEELSASINEISQQVEKTAENAKNASLSADTVGESIMKSNQEMQQMIRAMSNINEASGEIGKIIKTIEDIAFQTNILALNAAVEAARAGEAGKGFAVVADEVRNLASKSADASKNTAQLIENSMRAVEEGTRIADATAQSLLSTVEGVKAVTTTISDISSASNSQADSILSITQSMDQISNVVQTNSATAEESAAASEELAGQSKILKDLVGMFRLADADDTAALSAGQLPESPKNGLNLTGENYSTGTFTKASGADKY